MYITKDIGSSKPFLSIIAYAQLLTTQITDEQSSFSIQRKDMFMWLISPKFSNDTQLDKYSSISDRKHFIKA